MSSDSKQVLHTVESDSELDPRGRTLGPQQHTRMPTVFLLYGGGGTRLPKEWKETLRITLWV
jgi:hypothetical protein